METAHAPSQSRSRRRGVALALIAALVGVSVLSACAAPLIGKVGGPSPDPGQGSEIVPEGQHRRCDVPNGTEGFATADPEEVGLDRQGLTDAIHYSTVRGAQSVRVYRHGCLVGQSGNDPAVEHVAMQGWSMTKGVVSTIVGRAITLGEMALDDPIGEHLDGLDQAHAAITVRQLLTQTSGLRMAWINDLWAAGNADSAMLTLRRPFEAEPGTRFLYAQTTLTALVAVLEGAVGEDIQSFAARELFEPVGIDSKQWRWGRDPSGRSQGFFDLEMTPSAWSRLGQLLLDEGSWGGRRLISADYIREGSVGTEANPAYGFLWWTNRGDWHFNAGFPAYVRKDRPLWPTMPRDAFGYTGLFDQEVTVIPSLDMVVVRLGLPPDIFYDPLGEAPGIRPKWDWRFDRQLMQSVTDVEVHDPGDWVYEGPEPDVDWSHVIDWNLPPFG